MALIGDAKQAEKSGPVETGLTEGPSGKRGQAFLIISKGQRSTKNFYSLGR